MYFVGMNERAKVGDRVKYAASAIANSLRPWIGSSFSDEIPGWQKEQAARRGTVRGVDGEYLKVEWDDMPGGEWSGSSCLLEVQAG